MFNKVHVFNIDGKFLGMRGMGVGDQL